MDFVPVEGHEECKPLKCRLQRVLTQTTGTIPRTELCRVMEEQIALRPVFLI